MYNYGLVVYLSRKQKETIGYLIVAILSLTLLAETAMASFKPRTVTITNASLVSSISPQGDERTSDPVGTESKPSKKSDDGAGKTAPATVEELVRKAFPDNQNEALRVFKCESGLVPSKHSKVDVMSDGRAFSVGLTQINLTVTKIAGVNCPDAFQGRNKYAKVINEELYQKCVKLAENPEISLETAKIKYNGGNWSPWLWCSQNS